MERPLHHAHAYLLRYDHGRFPALPELLRCARAGSAYGALVTMAAQRFLED